MFVYKLENIDVNEKQAQLVKIYVKNNDYVEKGDLLCSLETTKVIFDVESEISGYVEFFIGEGDKVKFEEVLYVIKDSKEDSVVGIKESKNYEANMNKTNFILTKKAQEYLQLNNIKIKDIEHKCKGKKIIKLNDLKSILESDLNKIGTRVGIINNRKRVVIIGAGAGGEVVADILLSNSDYEIIGFVDDKPRKNFKFYGIEIIHENIRNFPFEYNKKLYDGVILSFASDMNLRKEIFELYKREGINFINSIDKNVIIGRNVNIGEGNFIGTNTYIGTSSEIGNNNWIAASVSIDHHNKIGNHNLFGPNFSSPGIVSIGNLNKFGANSSLSNYVKIGNNNVIMNNVSIYRNIGDNQIIKR